MANPASATGCDVDGLAGGLVARLALFGADAFVVLGVVAAFFAAVVDALTAVTFAVELVFGAVVLAVLGVIDFEVVDSETTKGGMSSGATVKMFSSLGVGDVVHDHSPLSLRAKEFPSSTSSYETVLPHTAPSVASTRTAPDVLLSAIGVLAE